MQIYKRLCPSVHWSVRWSVMVIELKIAKTRIFEAPVVTVCANVGRVSEGVDGGCMPLPTILLFQCFRFLCPKEPSLTGVKLVLSDLTLSVLDLKSDLLNLESALLGIKSAPSDLKPALSDLLSTF